MAKPLRSEDPRPTDVRFRDFGVLDTGGRSKSATATSITVNVIIALLVIVLGAVVKQTKLKDPHKLDSISLNETPPPPPPPPIKLPPPPKLPPVPKIEQPKIEPPKIELPKPVPLPPEIKPVVVPTPRVNLAPPAPRKVDPPPAPKVVNLGAASAAHIANNDPHPSAVRMGNPEIRALNGPAVAQPVNLGGGIHGMPASNTGSGAHATNVSLGNGAPSGTNLNGTSHSPVKIAGLSNGVPGGTATGTHGPVAVQIAPPQQAASAFAHPPAVATVAAGTPPRVTFKPAPTYTEEARSLHLEGNVTLRIRVTAEGSVQVLGVVHGLGHGLDQSAQQAAQAMRFSPAKDSAGHPIEWEGPVTVLFQLS